MAPDALGTQGFLTSTQDSEKHRSRPLEETSKKFSPAFYFSDKEAVTQAMSKSFSFLQLRSVSVCSFPRLLRGA